MNYGSRVRRDQWRRPSYGLVFKGSIHAHPPRESGSTPMRRGWTDPGGGGAGVGWGWPAPLPAACQASARFHETRENLAGNLAQHGGGIVERGAVGAVLQAFHGGDPAAALRALVDDRLGVGEDVRGYGFAARPRQYPYIGEALVAKRHERRARRVVLGDQKGVVEGGVKPST